MRSSHDARVCKAPADLEFKSRRGPLSHKVTLKHLSCSARTQASVLQAGVWVRGYIPPFQDPASGQISALFFMKLSSSWFTWLLGKAHLSLNVLSLSETQDFCLGSPILGTAGMNGVGGLGMIFSISQTSKEILLRVDSTEHRFHAAALVQH